MNTSSARQHVSINPDVEWPDRNRENQRIRELETENMSLRQQVGALNRMSTGYFSLLVIFLSHFPTSNYLINFPFSATQPDLALVVYALYVIVFYFNLVG